MRQALYRKYRPKTFDELIGQDSIVNILKNQIINNQISHAYIFSGTRGTGKTSSAKIFAKTVNCLNIKDGNPCNECKNCQSIENEISMDIVEMDAASNRRIDDIRQLRDQVIYPPANLKYKVYIIDEAHMVTNEGFNALLKIMEEPPKHLIFILATTELEKIPDTIISRTQRFEFKSLGVDDIKKQINIVLKKEDVKMEEKAVEGISNIASGAMRDALSILDQIISIGKKEIKADDVYDLLGMFNDEIKYKYVNSIFKRDIKENLEIIDEQLNKGKDSINFIKEIISYFNELLYIKIGFNENEKLKNLLDDISVEQITNSIDILLEYEELMKKSDSKAILFRLASIRLIDYIPRNQLEAKLKALEEKVYFLEKNGIKKVINSNPKKIEEEQKNEESVFVEEIKSEQVENTQDMGYNEKVEESENTSEEVDIQKEDDIESICMKIMTEKYPMTRIMMQGLKNKETLGNNIIFYLDENHISMALGMNIFIKNTKEDLKKTLGKDYEIKFKLYEKKLSEDDFEDFEKIKSIFPEDKLIIKD